MASLSDLPESQRMRVVRLGYWTYVVLIFGAAAAVMFVRGVWVPLTAPLSAVFVVAFVVMELYQPILIRRYAREAQKDNPTSGPN